MAINLTLDDRVELLERKVEGHETGLIDIENQVDQLLTWSRKVDGKIDEILKRLPSPGG